MKTLITLLSLSFAATTAQALECKYNDLARDGDTATFRIGPSDDGTYSAVSFRQRFGWNRKPEQSIEIAAAHCQFSKRFPLIGECDQLEGPLGQVYSVRTSLVYSFAARGKAALSVRIIAGRGVVADALFPLESCSSD